MASTMDFTTNTALFCIFLSHCDRCAFVVPAVVPYLMHTRNVVEQVGISKSMNNSYFIRSGPRNVYFFSSLIL